MISSVNQSRRHYPQIMWVLGGLVVAVVFAWGSLVLSCSAPRVSAPVAEDPAGLKVVTYNINWGGSGQERVVAFLRDIDADIVCLQETHPRWEALLSKRLGGVYPHSKFITSAGAGGIAILTKHPLLETGALEAEVGWFPALRAVVAAPQGRIQVLNVHLRPPLSDRGSATPSALYQAPKVHRAEIAGFLVTMDRAAPLIVAGDFNEEEGNGAVRQLINAGYVDALSLFDGTTRTWEWPVVSGIALKRRYDHILFSDGMRCTSARVVEVQASDHMPVVAVLDLVPDGR